MPLTLPDPRTASSVGELVEVLRATKTALGEPSIRELTRIINHRRREHASGDEVTVSTVGYCFNRGRVRLDRDVLLDVVAAMGLSEGQCAIWAGCWRALTVEQWGVPRQQVSTQLPPAEALVGRDDELAELANTDAPLRLLLTGTRGAGSSALARELAHRVARAGQGRVLELWSSPRAGEHGDDPAASDLAAALLVALGVPLTTQPHSPSRRAAALAKILAGRRCVLLADALTCADEIAALAALDARVDLQIIATSHRQLPGSGLRTVLVDPLPDEAMTQLMAARLGPSLDPADRGVLREIAELCTGLPLVAVAVCGQITDRPSSWTLSDHLWRLQSPGALPLVDAVCDEVRTSLSLTSRFALTALAWHSGPDLGQAIAQSCVRWAGVDSPRAELDELVTANLVQYHQGRYRLHPLLRTYCKGRARTQVPHTRLSALRRMELGHYLRGVRRAVPVGHGHDQGGMRAQVARRWLRAERDNLMAAAATGLDEGFNAEVLDLATARRVGDRRLLVGALERESQTWELAGDLERAGDLAALAVREERRLSRH